MFSVRNKKIEKKKSLFTLGFCIYLKFLFLFVVAAVPDIHF